NKGKRAVLKGQFHISTEELRLQVVEAKAATATATASQRPNVGRGVTGYMVSSSLSSSISSITASFLGCGVVLGLCEAAAVAASASTTCDRNSSVEMWCNSGTLTLVVVLLEKAAALAVIYASIHSDFCIRRSCASFREVADEVRLNKCRVFQPQHLQLQQQQQQLQPQLQPQPQIPNLPLRQEM
ncbi:hypothetical protein V496_00260, partial [Pseudogymnoascus sp. VKM F-4515 (FW-2607)]